MFSMTYTKYIRTVSLRKETTKGVSSTKLAICVPKRILLYLYFKKTPFTKDVDFLNLFFDWKKSYNEIIIIISKSNRIVCLFV